MAYGAREDVASPPTSAFMLVLADTFIENGVISLANKKRTSGVMSLNVASMWLSYLLVKKLDGGTA